MNRHCTGSEPNSNKICKLLVFPDRILMMTLFSRQNLFRIPVIAVLLLTIFDCASAQYVRKDLETGLTTRGNGLSCNETYLSDGENIIQRNTFTYGETYYVNFEGMEGFEREGENAFPDMELLIISDQGDSVLHINDLYAEYAEGIDYSPLELYAQVTVANPMHSGGNYTLYVNIGDKRGKGTLKATLDFNVNRDPGITIRGEQVKAREIYLFSQEGGYTITSGQAGFDENIYLLFEGLDGFYVDDGQVLLGLSMVIKDADGNVILDESDLLGDDGLSYEDVHQQVAPHFILTGFEIANQVSCLVRIWDKKSAAWISASTELQIK